MKRWRICVFSYNRLPFLKNAVRSIEKFFPFGDRMVMDDGSEVPGMAEYLDELRSRGWTVLVQSRQSDSIYGGFYRNMRMALERSLAEGYDYLFFFEDDEQFVWKKDDYTDEVELFFESCPDAVQIQPLFARRIHSQADMSQYIRSVNAYRTNRGFSTTAVWNLDVVRRHPDYEFRSHYGDGLPANSGYWLSKGYRLYMQTAPTVAVLPWVSSQSMGQTKDVRDIGTEDFILNPLSEEAVRYLKERSPSTPAYQEYFRLSKENCDRPIWHQKGQSLSRYYELCRMVVEREDAIGSSPAPIAIVENSSVAPLPALESHMRWEERFRSLPPKMPSRWKKWPLSLRRIIRRLRDIKNTRFRDYLGYRELVRRLTREQSSLPFWREKEIPK